VLEDHLDQLDQELARLLRAHQASVQRLAEVPRLGVDSAQQIIAEVGVGRRDLSLGQSSLVLGRRLPRR
jgi:transposase